MDAEIAATHPEEPGEVARHGVRTPHVPLADDLELPAGAVGVPAALGVGRVTLHAAVLGVDVELDAPPRAGHTEVDVDASSVGPGDRHLLLDRDAQPPQGLAEHHLGM